MSTWPTRRLGDVADVRVSNVDKKVSASETPVWLCNYMDVYSNTRIQRGMEFMRGSASRAEIQRFSLRRGDVVITKDSESPDDIGVPAVVADDIEDLVCGYHLCVIRPTDDELNATYLAEQLGADACKRYFGVRAAGSTRFGLPLGAIENLELPFPPGQEQDKIAEVVFTLDRSIERTAALVAKHARIKTGLLQDLLTRGIDEEGNLRSEDTHKFRDSPVGRVPAEWDCSKLSRFVPNAEYGISTSLGDSGYPVLRMNNISDGEADLSDLKFTATAPAESLWLRDGDVLFNRTNSWEHVGRTGIWRGQIEKATFASYLVRLGPDPELLVPELLNLWLNWEPTQIAMRRVATPAVQQVNINPTNLRSIAAAFPRSLDEQREIVRRLAAARRGIASLAGALEKLRSLKDGLMQDLLTGKVRVTPLLDRARQACA